MNGLSGHGTLSLVSRPFDANTVAAAGAHAMPACGDSHGASSQHERVRQAEFRTYRYLAATSLVRGRAGVADSSQIWANFATFAKGAFFSLGP